MKQINATDLIGLKIISPRSKIDIGNVTDIIIQPVTGRVLGLVGMTRSGARLRLLIKDLIVTDCGVELLNCNFVHSVWFERDYTQGIEAFKKIVGKTVVTEKGKSLGKVSGIVISGDFSAFQYLIAEGLIRPDTWKKLHIIDGHCCKFKFGKNQLVMPEKAEKFVFKVESKRHQPLEKFNNLIDPWQYREHFYPLTTWIFLMFIFLGTIFYF